MNVYEDIFTCLLQERGVELQEKLGNSLGTEVKASSQPRPTHSQSSTLLLLPHSEFGKDPSFFKDFSRNSRGKCIRHSHGTWVLSNFTSVDFCSWQGAAFTSTSGTDGRGIWVRPRHALLKLLVFAEAWFYFEFLLFTEEHLAQEDHHFNPNPTGCFKGQ